MSGADRAVHRALSDDDDEAREALADELGRLTGSAAFTVAEFAAGTATIVEITRDRNGTPDPVVWEYAYTGGALQAKDEDEQDCWWEAMADPETFHRVVAPRFVLRTAQRLPSGLADLLASPSRTAPVYDCQASLQDLLRAAIRESPLLLGYELAVLARAPGARGTERLVLTGLPLFPPGETRGSQVPIRVSCEPTDADGTVFAVVTREPRRDRPRQAWPLQPLQLQAAVIPPGSYDLTAVLTRPGHVRFQGLPVPLGSSGRSWEDLTRLVPDQLTARAPVHLVCLVETCGGDDRLRQRIGRLEELITQAQAAVASLSVSVVAYGAHGVAWKVEDRSSEIRAWSVSPSQAVKALAGLPGRTVGEREYQRAAQLECALRLVRERLAATGARPVIVTAGGRPAHPPGLDTSRQIIPCPDWVDGMFELGQLARVRGAVFGALRDRRSRDRLWERLGRDATATLDDAVDVEDFAAALGLRAAAQTVPFPVAG